MSKTIDQKVVQMEFDNQNFERNAKETMSTLDKLKAALKFDGANKGAEELGKGIKNVGTDFSNCEIMATRAGFHIQDVWLKVSNVLEYKIARKIVSIGENLARSLTLDQVTAGFHEYELKMGSIQTIMAGTGEKLEVVNKYLNELNEYSDKTIYSFSDMTNNIGKFTNAGVKLKDAVAAIQGVANVAAVSGANAQEASRAMYNFAQALSAGYVKLIDWKSIENANMATVEFKDTLLQTAVAMGKAEENGKGMYKVLTKNAQGKSLDSAISATKNFNDSLAYQWMTTEVLTQALEIYSKDVRTMSDAEREAYEEKLRGQGFTDKQIEQFEELGIKATKAASEVKTFSQLMDTIKESIGSGWAMSFEHIIGNFNEAKELFTRVNDAVGVVIAQIDNKRNAMLENWKHMSIGGRDDLIEAFANLGKALGEWIVPIKKVFDEIFGTLDSRKLASIVKGFKDWTESIRLNEQQQENLRRALHYLLTPLKVVVEIVKFLVKLVPSLIRIGTDLIQIIIGIAGILATILRKNILKHTKDINNALTTIKGLFISLAGAIKNTVGQAFLYLNKLLKDSDSWLNKTIAVLRVIGGITLAGLRTALNALANFKLSDITTRLEKIKSKLKDLSANNKVVKLLSDAFDKLKAVLKVVTETFGVFFDTLKARMEGIETFGEFLQAVWDSLKDGYNFLKDFIESKFFKDGPGLFDTLKNSFQSFVDVLTGGMEKIPWAKLILIGFTLALAACTINLVTAISRFGGLAMALKETLTIINQAIKTFTGLRNRLIELKEIAIFITAITAAIAVLSYVDKENGNLVKSAATLGILAAGLMVLAEAMLWINTKNAFAPASLASLMLSIGALVAGTAVLVAAAGALKDMALSMQEALPYMKTLGVLMAGMLAAMVVLTLIGKDHKVFTAGAMTILAYAGSVRIMANALKDLSEIQFPNIKDLLKVLAELFAGFVLIYALSGSVRMGNSLFLGGNKQFNVLIFAASMKLFAMALSEIASLNLTEDAKKVLDMIIDLTKYIATLVGATIVLKTLFTKQNLVASQAFKGAGRLSAIMNSFALTLLSIAASFFIVSKAFESLRESLKTPDDRGLFAATLGGFLVTIIALTAIFAALSKTKATTLNEKALIKFSVSLVALTAALLPLALCLDLLADVVASHNGGEINKAAGIMVGIGLVMAACMWAAGQASFTSFQVLLTIFASFSALVAELVIITMVLEKHGAMMSIAMAEMVGIASMMGLLVYALAKIEQKVGHTDFKSLITIVSSLVVLAGVLVGLTFLTSEKGSKVWQAFGLLSAIAGLMLVAFAGLAAIKKWLGRVYNVIEPLITIVGSLTVMAGVLVGLALIIEQHGEAMQQAIATMGVIAGGLIVLFAALAGINKLLGGLGSWDTLLAFAVVLATVAGSLYLLAQVPWKELGIAAGIMVLFTGAMAGIMGLCGLLVETFPLAAAAFILLAGGIAVMNLSMAALVAAASSFTNAVARMVESLTDLGMNGDQVAEGLKKVTASIVDSIDKISTAILNSAPKLSAAATQLMVGISKGLYEGSKYISLAIATIVQTLIPVILDALQQIASVLFDGIKSLLSELAASAMDFQSTSQFLLSAFISGLTGADGQIAAAVSNWIVTMVNTLLPGVGTIFNIGNQFKQAFINGATPSDSDMKVVTESYDMQFANANTYFAGKAGSLSKNVSKETTKVRNSFSGLPADALSGMKKAADQGSKYAKQTTTAYSNAVFAGWSDIGKNYQTTVAPWLTKIKTDIGSKGLGGAIVDFAKDAGSNLKSYLFDFSIPGFDDLTENIKNATAGMEDFTPAATAAGEAAEEAGSKAKKGAKSAKEAADEVSSFVEKMEGSFNIFDEFSLGEDEENPLTGDKLLSNMRSNVDGMVKWSHEMKALSDKVSQGLYKKLADLGPQGYKYVHAFAQMTEDQLKEVNQMYATSLVIPTSVTAEIYQGMNLAAGNAYTGFVNGLHIEEFQTLGINLATGFLTGLTDPAGLDTHSPSKKTYTIGTYATQGLSNGLKDASALEGLYYTISNVSGEIIKKFRLGLSSDNFKDIGQQVLRGLNNGITSKNPDVLASISKLSVSIIDKVKSIFKIASPSKEFMKIGGYLGTGLSKGIDDSTGTAVKSATNMANDTTKAVENSFNLDKIANGINWVDKFLSIINRTPSEDAIRAALSKVEITFNNALSSMFEKSHEQQLREAYLRRQDYAERLAEMQTRMEEDAIKKAAWDEKIQNAETRSTKQIAEDMSAAMLRSGGSIGSNLVVGIINGIQDYRVNQSLSSALNAFSGGVIGQVKSLFGIHSPSTVFAKMGAYLDLGLAQGISDNIYEVNESVNKLSEQTINSMQDAVATIQTVMDSDLNVEPVIRPVVDLSNVQNGVGEINSLMGSNFSVMPQANFMQTSQLISNTDNTNVVDAVVALQEDVIGLKDAMTNIKMVLDTGTMVGAMTPAIDQELGARQVLAGRGI